MALGWREQYFRYKGFFLNVLNLYKQRADLRAFTEVILSVSTIAIFLLFALKPTALTIIELAKQINEKKIMSANLDTKIRNLEEASVTYEENQNSIQNLDAAIGSVPKPDNISKQIEALAAKDSVKILGFSIGQVTIIGKAPAAKKSEFKALPEGSFEMPISINLQGDYSTLTTFIKDFEALRIITKVDRVGISSSEISGERVIVALISGRVPYLQK